MTTQTKLEISLGEIAWPDASCEEEAIKESVKTKCKAKIVSTSVLS